MLGMVDLFVKYLMSDVVSGDTCDHWPFPGCCGLLSACSGAGVSQVVGVNQELVTCRGCLEQLGHRTGLQKCFFTSL